MTFKITHHHGRDARALQDRLEPVIAAAFAGPPYFEHRDADSPALARFASQTGHRGFDLVTAEDDGGDVIGLAFGYTLPASTKWWDGVLEPVGEDVRREDGMRTFGLFELAVAPQLQRRGIAAELHRALVNGREEERVVLNCRPDAAAAQAAYRSWGYRRVTSVIPWAGAPVYDVLLLDLAN